MLFPNSVQQDSPTGYLRWTQDSNVSAGDVYAMIGSPPVFRLRFVRFYFFSSHKLQHIKSLCIITDLQYLLAGMVGSPLLSWDLFHCKHL